MEPFDMCRCRVICTCGADDWGEVPDEDSLPGENLTADDSWM